MSASIAKTAQIHPSLVLWMPWFVSLVQHFFGLSSWEAKASVYANAAPVEQVHLASASASASAAAASQPSNAGEEWAFLGWQRSVMLCARTSEGLYLMILVSTLWWVVQRGHWGIGNATTTRRKRPSTFGDWWHISLG